MSSDSLVVESWISSFCNLIGHEYFAEVSEDFIEDDFNLTGLASQVPYYKEALEMILDVEPEEEDEDEDEEDEEDEDEDEDVDLGDLDRAELPYRRAGDKKGLRAENNITVVENSAEILYGLIHQRYICSRPGIGQMHEKYDAGHFGCCPRVYCHGCKVLPVGCSDTPGQETVKLFCPSCLDIYTPPNSRFQTIDGAYFGTTFGCLFTMTFPEIQYRSSSLTGDRSPPSIPSPMPNQPTEINGWTTSNFAPGLGTGKIYEPKIYGFRVNERARTGPRMKWLRMKPDDIIELDESQKFKDAQLSQDEDLQMHNAEAEEETKDFPQAPQISERKKAPIRRRRRGNSEEGAPAPMDLNGANGVG